MMNSPLKIQFLGTGTSQGIPVIGSSDPVCLSEDPKDKRLRSSVHLSKNGRNINIDCGPDFRYQMLRAKVQSLDAILFTHEHNDHVLGLDDTRPFIFKNKKSMPIYGQERVLKQIRERFPYVYSSDKYPGAPSVEEHALSGEAFDLFGFHVEPLPVLHGDLPIFGYLIDDKFAYITDASFISDEVKNKIRGVEVLVLNVLRRNVNHHSHFILSQGLDVVSEVNPKKAYFIHMSFELGFHAEVEKELPENVHLAYDGLEIEL